MAVTYGNIPSLIAGRNRDGTCKSPKNEAPKSDGTFFIGPFESTWQQLSVRPGWSHYRWLRPSCQGHEFHSRLVCDLRATKDRYAVECFIPSDESRTIDFQLGNRRT